MFNSFSTINSSFFFLKNEKVATRGMRTGNLPFMNPRSTTTNFYTPTSAPDLEHILLDCINGLGGPKECLELTTDFSVIIFL